MQPGYEYAPYQHDALVSPTTVDPASSHASLNVTPTTAKKRKDAPHASSAKSSKKVKRVGPKSDPKADAMANGDGDKDPESASKPKRVRTGCLTCRERHLKCDEAMPHCNNCKKSNRTCRRGVRLNFIDTWVDRPPRIVTAYGTPEWKVDFLDESREIASEYQGGIQRYKHLDQEVQQPTSALDSAVAFEFPQNEAQVSAMNQQPLPPMQSMMPENYADPNAQPQLNSNMFDTKDRKSVV